MDYWHELDVQHHADWAAFQRAAGGPRRLWLFTTRGSRSLWEADFAPDDGLVFGNENEGAPDWLHAEVGEAARVRIPQFNAKLRSLNLSTSVGIAVYEALRQLHRADGSSRGPIAATEEPRESSLKDL